MSRPPKDLTGQLFGKLTAREPVLDERTKFGGLIWWVDCECGNTKRVPSNVLVSGAVTSCGCGNLGRNNWWDAETKTKKERQKHESS